MDALSEAKRLAGELVSEINKFPSLNGEEVTRLITVYTAVAQAEALTRLADRLDAITESSDGTNYLWVRDVD